MLIRKVDGETVLVSGSAVGKIALKVQFVDESEEFKERERRTELNTERTTIAIIRFEYFA